MLLPPPKERDGKENASANKGHTAVTTAKRTSTPINGSQVFHDSDVFNDSSPAGVSRKYDFCEKAPVAKSVIVCW